MCAVQICRAWAPIWTTKRSVRDIGLRPPSIVGDAMPIAWHTLAIECGKLFQMVFENVCASSEYTESAMSFILTPSLSKHAQYMCSLSVSIVVTRSPWCDPYRSPAWMNCHRDCGNMQWSLRVQSVLFRASQTLHLHKHKQRYVHVCMAPLHTLVLISGSFERQPYAGRTYTHSAHIFPVTRGFENTSTSRSSVVCVGLAVDLDGVA